MVIYSTRDDLAIVYEDSGPAYLDYNTTWFYESDANDGSIGIEVIITLTGELFTDDAANHVTVANVPDGLTPVFERLSATQMRMTFAGQAASHLDGDSRSDIHVYFANEAFTGGDKFAVSDSNRFHLVIKFNTSPVDTPVVTSPRRATTVNTDTFTITGTAEANAFVQLYVDQNNNGEIDADDTFVASQILSGGATAFSIDVPLTQNAANNFVVVATVNGINSVAADVPTITQDSIAPSVVSFTRKDGAAEETSDDILRFVVTFSGPVTNVDASDFIITGVTDPLVNVWAIDGTSWNVVILGGDLATLNAVVGLNFAPDALITDAAGNLVTILEPAIDETYTVINP